LVVKIHLSSDVNEPYIIINAGTLTPEIEELAKRIENEIIAYDTAKKRFIVEKRLYEIETLLGLHFIRISKSAIVNIRKIDHVDVRISGIMNVAMKNGINEYISRRHMGDFKKRLGL